MGKGHNFTIDFYTLGAILYEMLTGLPPFYVSYVEQTDWKKQFDVILNNELNVPSYVSAEANSLIRELLNRNPAERLGAANGVADIKAHPWCKSIDWNAIEERTVNPPFVPSLDEAHYYATKPPSELTTVVEETKEPTELI